MTSQYRKEYSNILGREMEKQGIAKTLGALTIVVLMVRMVQVILM